MLRKTGITLSYNYIEGGSGTVDNGTVWYYDGSAWSLLEDPPKTLTCSGQGQWAHRSVALPSSANNNANVKIGFRWVNNDDGVGTDPSFAVDSVSLSKSATAPVASFTTTATTACLDSCITFTSTSTGTIDSVRWVIVVAGIPVMAANTNPMVLCFPATFVPPGSYTVRLRAYSGGVADSSSTGITIKANPHPAITKTGKTLTVPSTYLCYQWYNGTTAITGATNATYTFSVSGTYKVVVDSGGCKAPSNVISTLDVNNVNSTVNKFWVTQSSNNVLTLNSELALTEDLGVVITDQAGRQLLSEKWVKGSDNKQVSSSHLVPGIYFVRISNSSTAEVLKWIKQ
ncbi:MAG: hypothetical protein JWQ38_2739 [Flavipsychrobacter sp.]|nr:hypothetical protein [Flavipsychrobacter sp.]